MKKINEIIEKTKIFGIPILLLILITIYVIDIYSTQYIYNPIPPFITDEVFYFIEIKLMWILLAIDLLSYPFFDIKKVFHIIIFAIGYINMLNTSNTSLLCAFICAFYIRRIDLKVVFNYLIYLMSGIIVSSIIYSLIQTFFFANPFGIGHRGLMLRFTFGIGHPNVFAAFVNSIAIMMMYRDYGKGTNKQYVLSIIFTLFAFCITNSRTSFIIAVLAILLFYLLDKRIIHCEKAIRYFSMISFPLFGLTLMWLVHLYDKGSSVALFVNKMLTGRINLTSMAMNVAKPTLMGRVISFSSIIGGVVDSLYPYCLLKYGYIWLIILTVSFFIIAKKGSMEDCIVIILFSLFSCSEHMSGFVFFGGILILTKIYEPYEIKFITNFVDNILRKLHIIKK